MEPISSIAVGYATGKLVEITEFTIRKQVIERWSRYRAQQFFEAFCEAIADENISEAELQLKLDSLLTDQRCSEIVFDAYRAVCLTKSKTIGPRVIAILTAELLNNDALANPEESKIFSAAEELSDDEMKEFSEFALKHYDQSMNNAIDTTFTNDGSICIQMGEESFDSNWHRNTEVSLSQLNLPNGIGTWAAKLERHGLIWDDMKERQWEYQEDGERHIDAPGSVREITWWLYLGKPCIRFAHLICKVSKRA